MLSNIISFAYKKDTRVSPPYNFFNIPNYLRSYFLSYSYFTTEKLYRIAPKYQFHPSSLSFPLTTLTSKEKHWGFAPQQPKNDPITEHYSFFFLFIFHSYAHRETMGFRPLIRIMRSRK